MPRVRAPLVLLVLGAVWARAPHLAHAGEPAGGDLGAEAAAPARAMELAEAIAYAESHQPRVRAALARVTAQAREAEIPRAGWLPSVGATAQIFGATANNSTGTFVTPSFLDLPRVGATRVSSSNDLAPYASTLVGAGLRQELFDFGRIAARAAAEDALVDVARERARETTLDVTFSVEEAYFAVLAAKAVVAASDEAYERSRAHRDLAKAGVDAGLRTPIELTRAEADLALLDIGRIRARGGLAAARATLAAAVGIDAATLDARDAPAAPPDLPALEAAMKAAGERDPRLRAVLAELHAQERRTRALAAELRPDLGLTASLSGRSGGAPPSSGAATGGDGLLPNVPNWDVGLVVRWPIFDGVASARRDASRAHEAALREEAAAVRQENAARIRIAYGALDVARTVLPGLERAVNAARANDAQAEARFRSGLGTSVELADAEAVRTNAEIQLALGRFGVARARAAFGRAIAEGP